MENINKNQIKMYQRGIIALITLIVALLIFLSVFIYQYEQYKKAFDNYVELFENRSKL